MPTVQSRILTKPPVLQLSEIPEWVRQALVGVRGALSGQMNNTHSITLTGDSVATTTVVTNSAIGPATVVLLMPTHADAAALSVGEITTTKGSYTVNHAASASGNLDFRVAHFG